nr:13882_t:CDS:2 [Entrophospora candida]
MSPPKNNSRKFNKPSRGTGHRFTNARILAEDERRLNNKSATNLIEIDNPNRTLRKDNLKASDMSNITPEMSRRER